MKVCTFEPLLGCQAYSPAKPSTSSLVFDRAILFMSPLTVANYSVGWYRFAIGDAPDFVEVGEAGIAMDDAMRRQRRVQLVG
jgi:hypothetical protein